jgi:hypothetical protein
MKRKRSDVSSGAPRLKWYELWSKLMMASVIFICVAWGAYFWERTTGVTITTRSGGGRISTEESLSWTLGRSFTMTIVALPVLMFSAMKRRQYL